jgi:hypothetical protein
MDTQNRVRHPADADSSRTLRASGTVISSLFLLAAAAVVLAKSSAAQTARDPGLWPFSSDSPWNMPLGKEAKFAAPSDPATADVLRGNARVNANNGWSHPVYEAKFSDPLTTWTDVRGKVVSDRPEEKGQKSLQERTPAAATPAEGNGKWDRHMHVVAPDRNSLIEGFRVQREAPTRLTAQVYRTDLRGTGIEKGGTRAYGGSAIGGLIRIHEIQARRIPHAVAVAMGDDQLGKAKHGSAASPTFDQSFVWPATWTDGYAYKKPGSVRMGMLFAIPRSVDIYKLGLNPEALAVAKAMQEYGAYVVDYGAPTVIYMQQGVPDTAVNNVKAQANIIKNELRRVTNISRPNWEVWRRNRQGMGGGSAIGPFAPPFTSLRTAIRSETSAKK